MAQENTLDLRNFGVLVENFPECYSKIENVFQEFVFLRNQRMLPGASARLVILMKSQLPSSSRFIEQKIFLKYHFLLKLTLILSVFI